MTFKTLLPLPFTQRWPLLRVCTCRGQSLSCVWKLAQNLFFLNHTADLIERPENGAP